MKLVIDASVALKWFLRELQHGPHLDRAEAVAVALDQADTQLLAPVHWTAEIISVLARVRPALVNRCAGLGALQDDGPTLWRR